MWLIYGVSGCFSALVVIYFTYKFIAAKTINYFCPSRLPPNTPIRPKKISFPKRKILPTIQNRVE